MIPSSRLITLQEEKKRRNHHHHQRRKKSWHISVGVTLGDILGLRETGRQGGRAMTLARVPTTFDPIRSARFFQRRWQSHFQHSDSACDQIHRCAPQPLPLTLSFDQALPLPLQGTLLSGGFSGVQRQSPGLCKKSSKGAHFSDTALRCC